MTKAELKKLKRDGANIAEKLRAVEDAEREQQARRLVGTFWKYRNCYSCPKNDADYWWLYTAVVKTDGCGHLTTFQFQTDNKGDVRVDHDRFQYPHMLSSGHVSSTKDEFNAAWTAMFAHLASVKP